jgi:uncharacterized membrane protein
VSETALRRLTAALALVGLGIASYLTYVRYTGGTYACTSGGCELVQSSKYSAVAGVPVAVVGLVGYALILGSAAIPGEPGAALAASLTGVGFAFAAYLVYVQWALIEAFCVWCLASDVVMTLTLVVSVARLRGALRAGRAEPLAEG